MDRIRIAIPTAVQPSQPHSFPLMATIAPVAVSLIIWFVTRSPFALIFAALGPAVAIASVFDARMQAKRRLRSEKARFARELGSARADTVMAHDRERHELDLDAPSAASRLGRGDYDPERFSASISDVAVTLGRGIRRSTHAIEVPTTHSAERAELAELELFSAHVVDAPVPMAAALGIALVGEGALASAVARGVIVQLAAQLSPVETSLLVGAPVAPQHWLTALPHRLLVDARIGADEVVFRSTAGRVVVAFGRTVNDVPSTTRVVVEIGAQSRVVRHPDRLECGPVALEYVSREQAREWALRLAALAQYDATVELPTSLDLAPLLHDGKSPAGLTAVLGVSIGGRCEVDLVRDGPHAIVAGTTGSGKSELLIAWVLCLAAAYSPAEVTFLLVDFKGGASFAPLEPLPHCVGVISDLDERTALRALESLKAEVRFRERALAQARVRSIEDLSNRMPRLVVVVDEFAAMVGEYPDLHAVFSDLAARGRSLGLHLVLCTQRPAGVVRDAVLANSGLRISLRVNNRSDSHAVIGTDAAAILPAWPKGRALVAIAGNVPIEMQVPLATAADADAVTRRWQHLTATGRKPWCDPLPDTLSVAALAASDGIAFGLSDHPHEQAQPTAVWNPPLDGSVLVLGATRSGKSGFLRAVSAGARVVPPDPEQAWDAVAGLLAETRRADEERVVVIDDLDALLARFGDEHSDAFVDGLSRLLREGPASGIRCAIATQRLVPALHSISALCNLRLLLRMSSKHDHIVSGGEGAQYDGDAPPGRGIWRGHPVQVAHVDPNQIPSLATPVGDITGPVAVVTASPHAFAERARSRGFEVSEPGALDAASVVVGDSDAWQARWGALQAINATRPVFFEGCSIADFRMLTRSRRLPPPIVTSLSAGWLLAVDGEVTRARF